MKSIVQATLTTAVLHGWMTEGVFQKRFPTGGEVRRSGTTTFSTQKDGKVAAQHPAAGGTLDGPTVGANVVCACAGLAGTHVAAREERDVGLCRHAEQATIPRLRGLCVPEDVPLGPSWVFH